MQTPMDEATGRDGRRLAAVAFTALLAIAGAALLVLTPRLISGTRADDLPYYRSPSFFPIVALAIVTVGAVLHVLRLRRGADMATDEFDEPTANWPTVLGAFGIYAAYVAAVPLVGYTVATGAFLLALGSIARLGWRLPLVLAVVVTGALFAAFILALNVWFPAPLINLAR